MKILKVILIIILIFLFFSNCSLSYISYDEETEGVLYEKQMHYIMIKSIIRELNNILHFIIIIIGISMILYTIFIKFILPNKIKKIQNNNNEYSEENLKKVQLKIENFKNKESWYVFKICIIIVLYFVTFVINLVTSMAN